MTRQNTCPQPDCGHYLSTHTQPGVPGGCLVIVNHKTLGPICCGCVMQYPEGLSKEDVEKHKTSGYFDKRADQKIEDVTVKLGK